MNELLQIQVPSLDPTSEQQAQDFVGRHFAEAEVEETRRRAVAIAPTETTASINAADYGSYQPSKFLMDSRDPRRHHKQERSTTSCDTPDQEEDEVSAARS